MVRDSYNPKDRSNARIDAYCIEVGQGGQQWHEVFENSNDIRQDESKPVGAKFVKRIALSEVEDKPFDSIAELFLIKSEL